MASIGLGRASIRLTSPREEGWRPATANAAADNAAMYAWKPKANPWLIAASGGSRGFYGGAGYLDRERGAPSYSREPGSQFRSEHVGPHLVPGSQRDRFADGRLGRQRDWAEEFLHALHRHLHGQFLLVRNCAYARPFAALPRISGRRRRRLAADGASHHGRLLRAVEARSCIFTLRGGCGAGAFHRANSRRMDHR